MLCPSFGVVLFTAYARTPRGASTSNIMFGWLLGDGGRGYDDEARHGDVASDQPKSQAPKAAPLAPFATAGYSFSALQSGPAAGFADFVVEHSGPLLELISIKEEPQLLVNSLSAPLWVLLGILLDFLGKSVVSKLFFCDVLLTIVIHTELQDVTPQQEIMREQVRLLREMDDGVSGPANVEGTPKTPKPAGVL